MINFDLMRVLSGVLIFLVTTLVSFARLGEKEAELIKRFGAPLGRSQATYSTQGKSWPLGIEMRFQQDIWMISCLLIDERCVSIGYNKRGDWSEAQIATVLNANAQGAQWTPLSSSIATSRSWRRTDGAIARWTNYFGMRIESPYVQRAKDIIDAKARAEVSGRPKI